ncbi:DNA-binding response regulator [Aphanothece hegewaldii CCALA 016]|uniref:DNA-binding response regulator n=1 Tax=Aphanothece hegewaldii CCALA 016 TaxID=2107694 RepID=A0A2T1LRG6_9CHRO|nr:two-component system response regulator RppA [Aphanothece hegewaldii]PSF31264.1 DNA-binding response regulator [Aphanothece hegewaldii CCALA 016]
MRILLVEDEPDLGMILQKMLSREKYLVDWVQDGTTAWNYLDGQWTQYSVAIFDWLLPGISGDELCQRLRRQNCSLPVLMLTAKDRLEDMIAGLDAGADDYLMKPFVKAELLARLRALQRRSPQVQASQIRFGRLTIDYPSSTIFTTNVQGQPHAIPLTANEFRLLEYFMKHPNQTLTREQILEQLWKTDAEPISNVVSARIRLLRRKLAEYECAEIIETVHGFGYRLIESYVSK